MRWGSAGAIRSIKDLIARVQKERGEAMRCNDWPDWRADAASRMSYCSVYSCNTISTLNMNKKSKDTEYHVRAQRFVRRRLMLFRWALAGYFDSMLDVSKARHLQSTLYIIAGRRPVHVFVPCARQRYHTQAIIQTCNLISRNG